MLRTRKENNSHSREIDYLIVGAGFAGSVLAERLASAGFRVMIIDRRNHIAGNAFDFYNEHGVLIHKYGPHIFHTNSAKVFNYLSRFTDWRPYEHRVLASVDGQLVPMPINIDTINKLYGLHLDSNTIMDFYNSLAEPLASVLTSEDVIVSKIGRELYTKFFKNYTQKQWGMDPSELDKSVTSRVPIRHNRDDRYFQDTYQSMPLLGYTKMFEKMLDHENIHVMLNADFKDVSQYLDFQSLIYTGPVDEYYDFCYGKLPYRSINFSQITHPVVLFQSAPVINYPNEHLYTRATEFKYLTGQVHHHTTVCYEYPCAEGDPYYPIPTKQNAGLYKQYETLAGLEDDVAFSGRLGTYKYYNMDQVVAQSLALFDKIKAKQVGSNGQHYTKESLIIQGV